MCLFQVFWPFIPVSFCLIWSIVYKSSFVIWLYSIIWIDVEIANTRSLVTVIIQIIIIWFTVFIYNILYTHFLVPFTYFAQAPHLFLSGNHPLCKVKHPSIQLPKQKFPDKQYQVIYPFPKSSCSASLCSIIMTISEFILSLILKLRLCFQVLKQPASHSAININTCSK